MMNTGRSGGRDGSLKRHHVKFTASYHAIAFPVVAITMISPQFRTGPCSPGLDLVTYLADGIITMGMFVTSSVKLIFKGRTYLWAFVINLLALVILLILYFVHG